MDGGGGIWCGVSAWGPRTHSNDYDGPAVWQTADSAIHPALLACFRYTGRQRGNTGNTG